MGIHLIPVHSFQILQLLPERLQALIIHALHLRQADQDFPHPGQNGRQTRKLPYGLRRGQRQKSPASHKNRASRQPGQAPGGTYPQHGIPPYRAFPCLHGIAPFLTGAQRRLLKKRPRSRSHPHTAKNKPAAARAPPASQPQSAPILRPPYQTIPATAPAAKKGMLRHSTASTAFSSHCMREILLRHSCPTIKGITISWLNRFLPERQKCFSANEWGNVPFRSFPTLPDGGKFQHRRAISAINSRTSSSRVAQLVQKRTVLWVSSSRRK